MKPLELEEVVAAMEARPLGQPGHHLVGGVSTDSRDVQPGQLFFALEGARLDGHRFVASAIDQGAIAAVVSHPERVPDDLHEVGLLLLVDDTTAALGRLAAFHRTQVRAAVIGVTGSNGKTTTKEMIHQVLRARWRGRAAPKSFNNAVGVPLTLLSVEPDDDYVVVEIGSNAPGEVAHLARMARPDIGVITSVSETHLERLKNLEGVAAEKASLVESIRDGGCAIVNAECGCLIDQVRSRRRRGVRFVRFGRDEGADLRATDLEVGPDRVAFRVNGDLPVTLPMPGPHNALNALAALAVGEELGVAMADGAEQLIRFEPPAMRMEVHRWGDVTFVNDAYNANPAGMAAALEVLGSWPAGCRRVFVAGQMRELGAASLPKHQELGGRIGRAGIEVLVAVGDTAQTVVEAARHANPHIHAEATADVAEAAVLLEQIVRPGDVVMIKGSRAVGLEALAETVRAAAEKTPASGAAAHGQR